MTSTPNLNLPYIIAAQAQKHVTHNEAIRVLDAIVQLSVLDRNLTAPPGTPSDGDCYLVAAGSTGDWAGHDQEVAAYQDGAWAYYTPQEGWFAWIADEDVAVAYDGAAWISIGGGGGGSVNPTPLVGVNATADTTDRLKVSSPNVLFDHEGTDHRLKINKNGVANIASVVFQTGYSGRAEIGTTGDDDFHFKVSPDGTTFHEAILLDKDDGSVSFPNTTFDDDEITAAASATNYTPSAATVAGHLAGIDTALAGGGGGGTQPGFMAQCLPGTDNFSISAPPTYTACTWSNVLFDTNSNYVSSTGVYTIPEDGKYALFGVLDVSGDASANYGALACVPGAATDVSTVYGFTRTGCKSVVSAATMYAVASFTNGDTIKFFKYFFGGVVTIINAAALPSSFIGAIKVSD